MWISMISTKSLCLMTLGIAVALQAPRREFELIPYYRIAHERYNLYWQCRA
jgi:hypothetical protein